MKKNNYLNLLMTLTSLIENETNELSLLANVTALIKTALPQVSWVGFYLLKDGNLLLGPFQGKVACTVIPLNKGVCGQSARTEQTVLVKNVHLFPGHIACDSAANSEIVIPIIVSKKLYGVLDLDSTSFSRFTKTDKFYLEEIVAIIARELEKITK